MIINNITVRSLDRQAQEWPGPGCVGKILYYRYGTWGGRRKVDQITKKWFCVCDVYYQCRSPVIWKMG